MPAATRIASKKGGAQSPLTALKQKSILKNVKKPAELDVEDENELKEEKMGRKVKTAKGKEKEKRDEVSVKKKTKDAEVKETESTKKDKAAKSKATTKPKSKKLPTPESSDEEEQAKPLSDKAEEDAEKSGSEDEVLLHGFSSESDSSDEDEDLDGAAVDVGKLPTIAKDDATVKRKLEKAKKQAVEDRGVLYLARIPHGFYEDQMKAYFSQFGDVSRLRLSRNKKTGRSKHYAFIEFTSSAVAEIVAETMDNYLLMGHILRCKIIPKEEVHPELWVGANRKFRRVPVDRIARQQQNKARTDEEKEKVEKRLLKRQEQKKRKLQAAGIDYDFGSVAYEKIAKKAKQSV